jgi:uncharacterized protein (TIGR00369 family)
LKDPDMTDPSPQHVSDWMAESPYAAALGVRLLEIDGERARLELPYADKNSNPGKVLHGGCAASLGVIGAQCVARAALGSEAASFHTASLQVHYLAAARDEAVFAHASLQRRGKAMCFVDVHVSTADGKDIAQIAGVVRGRGGAPTPELARSAGDDGACDPGAMGPHLGRIPFMANRGIAAEHMVDCHSRITMPCSEANADVSGGVHEGALLALLDTTGAMAAWATSGPGPYKASTVALQGKIFGEVPKEDLVGYGRTVQRDGDLYWADVEIAGASEGRVISRGTVIYRIVQ